MNKQGSGYVLILALICQLLSSCTIRVYDTNRLISDYKTQGFLDNDHYQVIISGFPDKNSRGLVQRRESAINDAKDKMNESIIQSLVKYSVNHQLKKLKIKQTDDILNITEAESELAKEFEEFLEYGYVAFEYYNEDNSAVIVYRIYKQDLIDQIESVEIDLQMKEPDSKE